MPKEDNSSEMTKAIRFYTEVEIENNFKTMWCITEVEDFSVIPYPGAKLVRLRHYWPGGELVKSPPVIEIPIEGAGTWLDLWRAADKAVIQSDDLHHCYIEKFTPNGDALELFCGS